MTKNRKPSSHIPLELCNSNNNLKGWSNGICSDLYQQLSWKAISESKWCPAWRYRCSYKAGTCSLSQRSINWKSVLIHMFQYYFYLEKQQEHSYACRVVTSVSTGTWCYPLEYFQPASGCPSKGKSEALSPAKFPALLFPFPGSQQEAIVKGRRVTLPLPVQIRDV